MRTGVRILIGLASTAVAAVLITPAAGAARIKPGQHFVGIVNGPTVTVSAVPVIHTVCAGPSTPGRTGPVAGGQTVAVARVGSGNGYTGPFRQVYAWIEQDASTQGVHQVKLVTYSKAVAIPTSVRVPCDGTGQVTFSSCPRLAPCAFGWVPTEVAVRFVNIAD